MDYKIAILPGDGIGPEVISEAVKILKVIEKKYDHSFELLDGIIGGAAIDKYANPIPKETLSVIDKSDAILFGAVGGPKWDDPNAELRPEDGILFLRKSLNLFANLRPIKIFKPLIDSSPIKSDLLNEVDIIVVRELTGGLYFGSPKKRWVTAKGRKAVDTLIYSESEIKRILKVAFQLASSRNQKLASIDKANVLETGRLWRQIATEMSKDYPNVNLEHILVDNASMQIIQNPYKFDVIVSENTFGDILTDEASVLSGSMGMIPSASLSSLNNNSNSKKIKPSLYEPIHGTAPDIAGKGIANPIGMILSVALMLNYSFGLKVEADAIYKSINSSLSLGYRTKDIVSSGYEAISTSKMGDIISDAIE